MMDENNNLNRTDSGQPQNEYTGEYGNSVETDGSADSVYSLPVSYTHLAI